MMKKFIAESPNFRKFIKFGTVGSICVVADFLIVFICFEKLFINKYTSNIISTSFGVCLNYLLNRMWTFRSTEPWRKEFLKFVGIGLLGILFNNLIVYFGNDYVHHFLDFACEKKYFNTHSFLCLETMRWSFYGIKFMAIGIVFFWNFFINHKFNFKPARINE